MRSLSSATRACPLRSLRDMPHQRVAYGHGGVCRANAGRNPGYRFVSVEPQHKVYTLASGTKRPRKWSKLLCRGGPEEFQCLFTSIGTAAAPYLLITMPTRQSFPLRAYIAKGTNIRLVCGTGAARWKPMSSSPCTRSRFCVASQRYPRISVVIAADVRSIPAVWCSRAPDQRRQTH